MRLTKLGIWERREGKGRRGNTPFSIFPSLSSPSYHLAKYIYTEMLLKPNGSWLVLPPQVTPKKTLTRQFPSNKCIGLSAKTNTCFISTVSFPKHSTDDWNIQSSLQLLLSKELLELKLSTTTLPWPCHFYIFFFIIIIIFFFFTWMYLSPSTTGFIHLQWWTLSNAKW